jgi:Eukaryotic aspartyl protease
VFSPLGFNLDVIQGYWQLSIDEVVVNGKRAVGTTSAIIDTGTSINCCDNTTVQAIYDNIPGSATKGDGTYTCTFVKWFTARVLG